MSKVLCVVSEHGFWTEELLAPVDRLEKAGIEVHFASPTGAQPLPDGGSLDSSYARSAPRPARDQPRDGGTGKDNGLGDLPEGAAQSAGVVPVAPLIRVPTVISSALEDYYRARALAWEQLADYDALLLVGGSGPYRSTWSTTRGCTT